MRGSWIIKQSLQKICAEENIACFLRNFLVKVYLFDNKTDIFNMFQKNRKVPLRYLREAISCTFSNLLQTDYTCPIPSHYSIEPGNICNLRCRFCPTGRRLKGFRRGFLSLENFKIMFDKIAPYAKRIAFYNWGEPLLNKDLLSMISICTDNGIRTDFDSNLNVYIGDKEAEAIVKSGLSAMAASIDGASQETYEKYRVGGNFKLAIDNLERLQNAKEHLNIKTPNLTWKFLINKFNEHEVEKAKEIASNIGVSITFSLMGVSGLGIWGGAVPGSPVYTSNKIPIQ